MRFAPLRAFWGTSSNVATVALGGVRKGAERRPWKGLLRILSPGLLWFPMADRSQSERAAETSNARPSRVPRSLLLVLPCSLALMSCLSSSNNSHKRARCVCVSGAPFFQERGNFWRTPFSLRWEPKGVRVPGTKGERPPFPEKRGFVPSRVDQKPRAPD